MEATQAAAAPESKPRTKPDPELAAMARIGKVLNTLDPAARARVAAWTAAKAQG